MDKVTADITLQNIRGYHRDLERILGGTIKPVKHPEQTEGAETQTCYGLEAKSLKKPLAIYWPRKGTLLYTGLVQTTGDFCPAGDIWAFLGLQNIGCNCRIAFGACDDAITRFTIQDPNDATDVILLVYPNETGQYQPYAMGQAAAALANMGAKAIFASRHKAKFYSYCLNGAKELVDVWILPMNDLFWYIGYIANQSFEQWAEGVGGSLRRYNAQRARYREFIEKHLMTALSLSNYQAIFAPGDAFDWFTLQDDQATFDYICTERSIDNLVRLAKEESAPRQAQSTGLTGLFIPLSDSDDAANFLGSFGLNWNDDDDVVDNDE